MAAVPPVPPLNTFLGLLEVDEYYNPPPAEGVPSVPLRPVCPYIIPADPIGYYNAFHQQAETALQRERKDIHDALLRPIGMTIDNLTPEIPEQFFRQREAGEVARTLMPRMLFYLHREHEKKMDRVCALSRRMNIAIKTMRNQQERLLRTILPLLPQIQDPTRAAGVMTPDVEMLIEPVVREYMPSCDRASCWMCREFDGPACN